MAEPSVLFVLAMSRSGTSAITRVLSLAGIASLPSDLLEPNDGNPAGYWEPAGVVALNDRFLERRGSNYYDPTLFVQSDDTAFDSAIGRDYADEIAAFFAEHEGDTSILVKDPRMPAVAPYWFRGACRAGRSVRCILPVREPRAAIVSLAIRDRAACDFANVLWLKYTLLAERVSRRFPRVFVDYTALLADWRSQVVRVERELGFEGGARAKKAVRAFVDPHLNHADRAAAKPMPLLPFTEAVYGQFARAARDEAIDVRFLDEAFAAFARSETVVSARFARPADSEFYAPGGEVEKWGSLGVRFARELAKGPPFRSA